MGTLIHACMACGKVTYEVKADNVDKDYISHGGVCENKACKTKIDLMTRGLIPLKKTPPIWGDIKAKEAFNK